jgi:hypothetical protein
VRLLAHHGTEESRVRGEVRLNALMPRRRRYTKQRQHVLTWEEQLELVCGPRGEEFSEWTTDAERREAWEAYRDELAHRGDCWATRRYNRA